MRSRSLSFLSIVFDLLLFPVFVVVASTLVPSSPHGKTTQFSGGSLVLGLTRGVSFNPLQFSLEMSFIVAFLDGGVGKQKVQVSGKTVEPSVTELQPPSCNWEVKDITSRLRLTRASKNYNRSRSGVLLKKGTNLIRY